MHNTCQQCLVGNIADYIGGGTSFSLRTNNISEICYPESECWTIWPSENMINLKTIIVETDAYGIILLFKGEKLYPARKAGNKANFFMMSI